ncbi:related to novobiocin biosynthesis protein novR [Fusarium fujikuroi]|uniref:Class II aldolase/adducin N-terminal domain-containing protein n=1 Tax=Fusarium fujikuroi TaxID=5127 RepID=A0A0I9Z289_FUSFU|nr:novobiocin biosynthesis protein novR [Fusarium fujikuroi]KLP01965.1 novobiocin biosynthesis protein novR [Fusarium fujikuroi]SCN82769.1 related to novobiocin biosynthesis protein novR [Fusarium fujikuroi]SCO09250.1 related to novobiocin biosynthesis protein novR [Fusarium fujikuroi]SCO53514.1 related to novobiocin biosynthesis protein novR [Fusarium fujikuroi]
MPPSAQVNEQPQEFKKTPLQLISQGVCLPGIPKHPTFALQRQWQLEKMALAFRVFARLGYTDGMAGHISVRDPENPHTFWTNPLAVHFGMLKASDMILVDYEGNPIGGNMSRTANAAGFLIHSAVHKARPDVVAACHTHSVHGMAWSVFGRRIEMITQDAAYLYGDAQTVYRDFGGVVVTEEEGDKIGAALGTKGKAMILQNHGLLTTGTTVDEACFLMTLMERACQCQLLAEAAAANGIQKVLISDASAKYTFENSSDPETLYWEGQPDLEYEEYLCKGEHKL